MRKAVFVIAIFWLCMSVYFGYLKIQSYVLGIYTKIDVSQAEVRDMQRFMREFLQRYDTLTDYQRREMEKERLRYELKVLDAMEPFVSALEDANQIGE